MLITRPTDVKLNDHEVMLYNLKIMVRVYSYLQYNAGLANNEVFLSIEEMAKDLKYDEMEVQFQLDNLENIKLIKARLAVSYAEPSRITLLAGTI